MVRPIHNSLSSTLASRPCNVLLGHRITHKNMALLSFWCSIRRLVLTVNIVPRHPAKGVLVHQRAIDCSVRTIGQVGSVQHDASYCTLTVSRLASCFHVHIQSYKL